MYQYLTALHRKSKRRLFLALDTALIPLSFLAALGLRLGEFGALGQFDDLTILIGLLTVSGAALVQGLGLHRIQLQALETRAVLRIGLAACSLAIAAVCLSYALQSTTPRSVPLIFGALFFAVAFGMRALALQILTWLAEGQRHRQGTVIYGAGVAGLQMALALRQSSDLRPVAFLDDNPAKHGVIAGGLAVRSPADLPAMVTGGVVQQVVVAMPQLSEARRDEILTWLAEMPVEVRFLPSYDEILDGADLSDQLRTVSPDKLLGRDKVDLDIPAVAKAYAGRSVLVTGAGGSIGSELCRQIINCRPSRLILLDHSEFALYTIDRDIAEAALAAGVELVAKLGSVTDQAFLTPLFREQDIDIVLHAAAYKHVPMVECNELVGAQNNVIGTHLLAATACRAGVERFILVSTDKAVRPTNVMGATKRLAELVIQHLQARHSDVTLSMVRFGNVLGSSGSVLPLFQRQIEEGGPVTVTHPDVTRFFMTIPEAARLVLLAGAYAEGADVFVLDMGEPVRIYDIARRMIALAGRKVYDPEEASGDIEIVFSGLRPGEKLFEELLIDDDSLRPTPHPKILRAQEAALSELAFQKMIRGLTVAIEEESPADLRQILREHVSGFAQPVHDQPAGKRTLSSGQTKVGSQQRSA